MTMVVKRTIDNNYKKYILTGVFSTLILVGYAQEEKKQPNKNEHASEQVDRTQPRVMDSIEVVREYRPILADAVKIRRTPDMKIDRATLAQELREIAASMYFARNNYKQPYHSPLPQRYPNASRDNIDNNRIGIIAYLAGEYERAASILSKVQPTDAFYQSSLIGLGNIALKNGDKQAALAAFQKAAQLNYDQEVKADGLFNYGKILYELDSVREALQPLQEYIALNFKDQSSEQGKDTTESRITQVLTGTSNFQAGVYLLESFKNREEKAEMIYQKVTYYRGMQFY